MITKTKLLAYTYCNLFVDLFTDYERRRLTSVQSLVFITGEYDRKEKNYF